MININDSPPKLSQDTYETVLLLPTYMGVEVLRVAASDPDMNSDLALDPDKPTTPQLVYSLVDGNVEYFSVEHITGVVTVINPNLNKDRYLFNVKVCITSLDCICLRQALIITISTGKTECRVSSFVQTDPVDIQCLDKEYFSYNAVADRGLPRYISVLQASVS